jgi:hypothetical protein
LSPAGRANPGFVAITWAPGLFYTDILCVCIVHLISWSGTSGDQASVRSISVVRQQVMNISKQMVRGDVITGARGDRHGEYESCERQWVNHAEPHAAGLECCDAVGKRREQQSG